jgi:hypothetical protein
VKVGALSELLPFFLIPLFQELDLQVEVWLKHQKLALHFKVRT